MQPRSSEGADRKRVGNGHERVAGSVPADQLSNLVRSTDLYGVFGGLWRTKSGNLCQEKLNLIGCDSGVGVERSEMD